MTSSIIGLQPRGPANNAPSSPVGPRSIRVQQEYRWFSWILYGSGYLLACTPQAQNTQSSSRLSLASFSFFASPDSRALPFVTDRFSCPRARCSGTLSRFQNVSSKTFAFFSRHSLFKLGADIPRPYEPLNTPYHFSRLPDRTLSLKMVCFH